MSWNQVKIAFAPLGAKTTVERNLSGAIETGIPPTIIKVDFGTEFEASPQAVAEWIYGWGFSPTQSNPPFLRYAREDADFLVETSEIRVNFALLNFRLDLDAREKLPMWQKFVDHICQEFSWELVDGEHGLVEPSRFRRVVEASFAWECFLEREKAFLSGDWKPPTAQ